MRVPLRIVCCVEKDHRFSTAQKRRNEKRENHGIVKESNGKKGENHGIWKNCGDRGRRL